MPFDLLTATLGVLFVMSSTCPQLGFELHLTPLADIDDATRYDLNCAFIECVAARGLCYNGRREVAEWSFVVWREGSQADDLDREAIRAWAVEQPDITLVRVGLLFDVGHSG
jgi:uncharacterized protein YggL (DUF469 family)